MQGSRREQPGMVGPGLSQQDKEIKPGGIESPPPLLVSCQKGVKVQFTVWLLNGLQQQSNTFFLSKEHFGGKCCS